MRFHLWLRRARYDDLGPYAGVVGGLARFRVPVATVTVEPWAVFGFGAAAVGVLLALGWARRFIAMMGPD